MVRLFSITVLLLLAACSLNIVKYQDTKPPEPTILPVAPYEFEFTVERRQADVFSALVELSQRSNLNVVTAEPKTGIARFEQESLSSLDLDTYCRFPVIDRKTNQPLDTFQDWDTRLLEDGATTAMRGVVTLTALFTAEHTEKTRILLRTNWAAIVGSEKQPCNSLGVFEERFKAELRKRLGYVS